MISYEEELKKLLQNKNQHVFMIKGEWGTGKTYFWKTFFNKYSKNNNGNSNLITESCYSYVSLFGISNLSDVKKHIVVAAELSKNARHDQFDANTKGFIGGVNNLFKFTTSALLNSKIPYAGISLDSIIGSAGEHLIKQYFICVDDIERRNSNLKIGEIFGLISFLKENNGCRIVLICNEDSLDDNDRIELNKYREKVIDAEITYSPNIITSFDLIFTELKDRGQFLEIFEALNLKNIRVMQQAKWCIAYFKDLLKKYAPDLQKEFLQQAVKLTCIHYKYANILPFKNLKKRSWVSELWTNSHKSEDDDDAKRVSSIIDSLHFISFEFDSYIIEYLENGYCDLISLEAVIDQLSKKKELLQLQGKCRNIFGLVYDNFQTNADEIATQCLELISSEAELLDGDWVSSLIGLVQQIAPDRDWRSVLNKYIAFHIPKASAGKLLQLSKLDEGEVFKIQIENRSKELVQDTSLDQLFEQLSDPRGWDSALFQKLAQFSERDMQIWFRNYKSDGLLHKIMLTLSRTTNSSHALAAGQVEKRIVDALALMASENSLNKYRVTRYVLDQAKEHGWQQG